MKVNDREINIPKKFLKDINLKNFFINNIFKIAKVLSFYRWYPDLYLDSFKKIQPPEAVGFKLFPYQRQLLRMILRYNSTFFCATRSSAKTFINILASYLKAMLYPNIKITIFASTLDQAIRIWKGKHLEIKRIFPLIESFAKFSFQKDKAEAKFSNGAIITVLALSKTSYGERSNALNMEESNLLDNQLYVDVIKPISIYNRILPSGEFDYMETSTMGRFTTSGFNSSSEHGHIMEAYKGYLDNNGSNIFGCDWRLIYFIGRLPKKDIDDSRIEDEAAFRQNFLCEWIGVTSGALMSINKITENRNLLFNDIFDMSKVKQRQYVICSDIAGAGVNNSIAMVAQVDRKKNGELESVKIVEICSLPRKAASSDKANLLKSLWKKWGGDFDQSKSSVQAIIVDSQTIGFTVVQELLKNSTIDGEIIKSFDFCTEKPSDVTADPEEKNSPKIIYCMNATKWNNTDVYNSLTNLFEINKVKTISTFDRVKEDLIIKYLDKKQNEEIDLNDIYKIKLPVELNDIKIQCDQVDILIREVSNLKKIIKEDGKIEVRKNIRTIEKDRVSTIAYILYYVNKYMSSKIKEDTTNLMDYIIGTNNTSLHSRNSRNTSNSNGFGGFQYTNNNRR